MTVSYGLWGLELAGREADEVTEAMVAFLLKTQEPDGRWTTHGRRPSAGGVGRDLHGAFRLGDADLRRAGPARGGRAAVAKAVSWVDQAPESCQEDRNFRLWGLHRLGAPREAIFKAREAVLAAQRED